MVRGVHTLLHNCLEQAVAERLILTNPAQGCKLPQLEKKEMKILPQEKISVVILPKRKNEDCLPLSTWSSSGFLPALGGVMVGHLQVPALEPDAKTASSLSKNVVTGLLKDEMGFQGLVFTDALDMKGVSSVPQLTTKALLAIRN